MYQYEKIKELIAIYDAAVACSKSKNHLNFYVCLKSFLSSTIQNNNADNKETTLLTYQMIAKSYVESDPITFNISVTALLISILGLLNITNIIQLPCCTMSLLFLVVFITITTILAHIKQQKLRQILFVLDNKTI